jgi:hypothetical protein
MPRFFPELNAPASMNGPQQPHDVHPHHGYDPNQPRVPAGHHEGGQWTSKPGSGTPSAARRDVTVDHSGKETWGSFANAYRPDGSLAEQRVFNRDGSRIVSEFNELGGVGDWDERHTVVTSDGRKVTFETAGDIQRIYDADGRLITASVWTDEGPEGLPIVQPAFLPAIAPAVVTSIELALILFTWLSSRNGPDDAAVLAYPVSEYRRDPADKPERVWVGRLTGDKLKEACPKYDDVQGETDKAARATNRAEYRNAAEYGTAVHTELRDLIREYNNPNLRPEVSLLKTLQETGERPWRPDDQEDRFGKKGSIRVDVLENTDTGTVCVYDIKTGKSGLYPFRIAEIARTVYLRYPKARRIMVIEMRPH